MSHDFAKVIQFGDELPNLFTFLPFDHEDDWSDEHEVSPYIFPNIDGGYDFNDGQSRKDIKNITKRFTLYSKCFKAFYEANSDFCGSKKISNDKSGYIRWLRDWMYRGLKGDKANNGYKRLYVQMEDGSIRWTWAKAISIPYTKSFQDAGEWVPFTVDFLCPDPYFYEVKDGVTFFVDNLPIDLVVCPCDVDISRLSFSNLQVQKAVQFKLCQERTTEDGLPIIIKEPDLAGFIGEENICSYPECSTDPCSLIAFGDFYSNSNIQICVNGSAGATAPKITFFGDFINPIVTNNDNTNTIEYNGTITGNEYLSIDLEFNNNGEITLDMVDTNIFNFDIDDIVIGNDGFFLLENGVNNISISGGGNNWSFAVKYINKYHN